MERDSTFAIGVKAPNAQRGVIKGRPALSHEDWANAIRAIVNNPGVDVLSVDSVHLPVLRARLRNITTLGTLRHLPYVDFVEPASIRVQYAAGCDESSATSSGSSGGDVPYGGPLATVPLPGSPGAFDYIGNEFLVMNIEKAWQLSTGQGVTVGVTDTGLDVDAPSEFSSSQFSSGASGGRSLGTWSYMPIGTQPTCSHGTRIAGLAVAPRNGTSIVGAAYGSNLWSVYQSDSENPDVVNAARAIHDAIENGGASVVVMAWGEFYWYDNISYEIDSHYYSGNVMFVGAAGTCPIGGYCPHMGSAVFPALKEEVLAVTGANYPDGSRPGNMYDYGNKSGVLAFTNLPTTGFHTSTIVNIAGSSAPTGAVGGIAALIRSRNPGMSNRAVMDRLIQTSGRECAGMRAAVWRDALVNAYAALGGICIRRGLGGPGLIVFYDGNSQDSSVTYTASAYQGLGSLSYHWMTGETSSSIVLTFDAVRDSRSDTEDGFHEVWVDVQDLGTNNPPDRITLWVQIINNMSTNGGGCVPVPPQITC